jgi:hypothetical protein
MVLVVCSVVAVDALPLKLNSPLDLVYWNAEPPEAE